MSIDVAYGCNPLTLIHCSWSKAVLTFCNRGEGFLTEEWCYPTVMWESEPLGIKPVSVKADSQGMISEELELVLANWDPSKRDGMKRSSLP
jgi:aromatic amino acid aminotransferase I / 2-aminoadipate transaminase